MRYSQSLIPTLKETPKDAEIASHQLMLRAGLIRQISSGIYILLPLALRVFKKVEIVIREEMTDAGAQELFMPSMIPSDLWKTTERWDQYGDQLLKIKDRMDREYCYGPTHEEVITQLAALQIKSYKQLPQTLYQIQTKFRDEIRPRFGLMRAREFSMKDAYSFHSTHEDLDSVYDRMRQAYENIFRRCGLDFKMVQADSGDIGGDESAEFMVTAETGEDLILESSESNYAANVEAAKTQKNLDEPKNIDDIPSIEEVPTPNTKKIEDLSKLLNIDAKDCLKAVLGRSNESYYLILFRGDHQLNECKIRQFIPDFELANDAEANRDGFAVGYLGPVGLDDQVQVWADHSLSETESYVVGANKDGVHLRHVCLSRDASIHKWGDFRIAVEGDPCPEPYKGVYQAVRGIEVGHIFKLGTKYSEKLSAHFLDEQGKSKPIIMGTYGIGVGRTIAASIEQHHDEKGIVWPKEIAPFQVLIVLLKSKDEDLRQVADDLYESIREYCDVLYDDRHESPGVKFKDADLLGIPYQIFIGNKVKETGECEWGVRADGSREFKPVKDVLTHIKGLL